MREIAKQALYQALVAIDAALDAFYVATDPDNGHDPLPSFQRRALEDLQRQKNQVTESLRLLVKTEQVEEDVDALVGTGDID